MSNEMPDEIWVGYYPDDGYTGESFDADIFDDGHNRTRYIKAPTNEGDVGDAITQLTQRFDFLDETLCKLGDGHIERDKEPKEFGIIRAHISQQAAALSEKDARIAELERTVRRVPVMINASIADNYGRREFVCGGDAYRIRAMCYEVLKTEDKK